MPTLRAYERERADHDRRCRDDVMARLETAPRPHEAARNAVLSACEEAVDGCRMVGFHCTRLTDGERIAVERDGLRPLSPELFQTRVTPKPRSRPRPSATKPAGSCRSTPRWVVDEMGPSAR